MPAARSPVFARRGLRMTQGTWSLRVAIHTMMLRYSSRWRTSRADEAAEPGSLPMARLRGGENLDSADLSPSG